MENRAIYESGLPHRAICVYCYLFERRDKENSCFPTIRTIAGELAFSRRTVIRAIEDLKEAGYLETTQRWRENGGRSSLLYQIRK